MPGKDGEFGWFKLDEGYFTNPKIQEVGQSGWSLHLAMCAWASANQSDGFVPSRVMPVLCAQARTRLGTCERLQTATLVSSVDGGWMIHDWNHYIRSKAQVEKDRARWRNTKRRQRMSTEESTEDMGDTNGARVPMSTEESAGESSGKQSKEKSYLPLPTTETQCAPDVGGRGKAALELMVRLEREHATDVRDERAWATRVRTNLAERYGAELERVCALYPTAPVSVVAGYVRGESTSIRYYERTDA